MSFTSGEFKSYKDFSKNAQNDRPGKKDRSSPLAFFILSTFSSHLFFFTNFNFFVDSLSVLCYFIFVLLVRANSWAYNNLIKPL